MKKQQHNGNPFGLALPVSKDDEVKRMVWGNDYKERDERSAYLRSLIARQQAEAPAHNRK